MSKPICVQGPIEQIDGNLVLLIPLEVGGRDLAPFATGIAEIIGDVLRVDIPGWLAGKLNLTIGSIVEVDNANGKFNIRPASEEDASASN